MDDELYAIEHKNTEDEDEEWEWDGQAAPDWYKPVGMGDINQIFLAVFNDEDDAKMVCTWLKKKYDSHMDFRVTPCKLVRS